MFSLYSLDPARHDTGIFSSSDSEREESCEYGDDGKKRKRRLSSGSEGSSQGGGDGKKRKQILSSGSEESSEDDDDDEKGSRNGKYYF